MRRLISLLLLCIVPLQFAWAAVLGVHGHVGGQAVGMSLHSHAPGHAHHDAHPGAHDHPPGAHHHDCAAHPPAADGGSADDHLGCHVHPVFSLIVMDLAVTPGIAACGGPIAHHPAAFVSRVPPLPDHPPLVRA